PLPHPHIAVRAGCLERPRAIQHEEAPKKEEWRRAPGRHARAVGARQRASGGRSAARGARECGVCERKHHSPLQALEAEAASSGNRSRAAPQAEPTRGSTGRPGRRDRRERPTETLRAHRGRWGGSTRRRTHARNTGDQTLTAQRSSEACEEEEEERGGGGGGRGGGGGGGNHAGKLSMEWLLCLSFSASAGASAAQPAQAADCGADTT
ncbi:unnamed protein product, partial [Prorocentrum cordatum]